MTGRSERSIDELYQDDPERADAVAFGRRTGVDRADRVEQSLEVHVMPPVPS